MVSGGFISHSEPVQSSGYAAALTEAAIDWQLLARTLGLRTHKEGFITVRLSGQVIQGGVWELAGSHQQLVFTITSLLKRESNMIQQSKQKTSKRQKHQRSKGGCFHMDENCQIQQMHLYRWHKDRGTFSFLFLFENLYILL